MVRKDIILIIFILVISVSTGAQNLYVSKNGNDANPGTQNSPLATIQAAADIIQSGDTVFIHEGNYHEEITLSSLKGTTNSPIVFKAYNNEAVVIDGTTNLETIKVDGTNWELATDSFPGTTTIYQLPLKEDVWQLFVKQPEFMTHPNAVEGELADYRYQVIARWPNSLTNPSDPITRKPNSSEASGGTWWSFSTTWAFANGEGTNFTQLTNNPSRFNLATTGKSFVGGTAVVSAIKQGPANQLLNIVKHEAGSNVIIHSGLPEEHEIYAPGSHHGPSFFVQHLMALDRPGEWYFDVNTKTVYLWPEGDVDPNSLQIRGKTQSYAFTSSNCNDIVIDGIGLFATSLKLDGDRISFMNGEISFPDMPKTLLNKYTETVPAIDASDCKYFSMINCVVEGSQAHVLTTNKSGAHIENNYFHNLGITGLGTTGCFMNMSKFIYNTVTTLGHRAVVKANGLPESNRDQSWNLLSGWGYNYANDGVGIQSSQGGSVNSVRAYNWFIRSNKPGHRYDGPDDGKGFPTLGLSHHLVGYKTMSVSTNIKGDYNQLYNYLGIESMSESGDIAVRYNQNTGEGNKNTIMRNCAADAINPVGGKWENLPCINSNNWDASRKGGTMSDFHPNAHLYDFRPRVGAPTINAGYEVPGITDGFLGDAPDIGAYEWGDDTYWIPGYKGKTTSFPIPSNGSGGIAIDRDLIFRTAYKSKSSTVYFGSDENAVAGADLSNANEAGTVEINSGKVIKINLNGDRNIVTPTMLSGNPNNFDPKPYLLVDDPTQVLSANSSYYWRADAIDEMGNVSKGRVWKFTTGDVTFNTGFKVYTQIDSIISEAGNATILLNGNEYQPDSTGFITGIRLSSGNHSYILRQDGFRETIGSFMLSSDTLIVDTLKSTSYNVSLFVVDKDLQEGIPNANVTFGENEYTADQNGAVHLSRVAFANYLLNASANGYLENADQNIEVLSDTTFTVELNYQYKRIVITVLDKTTEDPIYRAFVKTDIELKTTNGQGLLIMEKVRDNWWNYEAKHSFYFTQTDSVFVNKDTTLVVYLTQKEADVSFNVSASGGPIDNAKIAIELKKENTNQDGNAVFEDLPSRKEYIFSIEKEGYFPLLDTFYLETDTTISVEMQLTTNAAYDNAERTISIYPNPANDFIYIENNRNPSTLELINLDGKILRKKRLPSGSTTLNVSAIQKGYYLLRIVNKAGVESHKIIIQ